MSLDLEDLVRQEEEHESLAPVRDDLYEVARDYIKHLGRERDEHDNPHTEEARRAKDEYELAKRAFRSLRTKRQKKINIAVYTPGNLPREIEENVTKAECEYMEKISEADEDLRRMSAEDGELGQSVKGVQ